MSAFRDLQNWLKGRFSFGSGGDSRRPDGGTSCYRPVQRKGTGDSREAREQAAAYAERQPQIPYVHTGFTDMNPPAGGTYAPGNLGGDPYGYGAAQAAQQEYRAAFAAGQEIPPAGNNISYMPGAYAPDAGSSFTHIEHIMTMTSLRSCYEAIECMKNGETLIVTLDAIVSESENIRCQDMLAGAAFTLGCTVRMLQGGSVVVIAPAGVKVLPERRGSNWENPVAGYSAPLQQSAPPQQEEAPRRERRASQNAVGWENAFSEENRGYNPYTGRMPAAVGDYGNYGGYGYPG